jgi:hypothetical protein
VSHTATWLDDGPIELPSETRRAISVGLRTQPRPRRLAILGGSSMSPINRFATAAVIVLAVGALSAFVLSNRGGGPGGTPPPSASGAPSAAPSPLASPSIVPSPSATTVPAAGWTPFTSSHYGYTIATPDVGQPEPRELGVATNLAHGAGRRFGRLPRQLGWTRTGVGFAADVPAGTSEDA